MHYSGGSSTGNERVEPSDLPHQEAWKQFEASVFNLQGLPYRSRDEISDALVLGDTSLVLESNFELFKPSLDEALYWIPSPFPLLQVSKNDLLKHALIQERIQFLNHLRHHQLKYFHHRLSGTTKGTFVYLCHAFGWYPFGHLHDTLQRLYAVRDIIQSRQVKFIASDYNMVVNFKQHLSILADREITNEDMIVAKAGQILQVENLVIPYSPAVPTTYTPETYCWIVNKYLSSFDLRVGTSQRIPGIYLSRNHVLNGSRTVINEVEVIEFLKERGFIVVNGTEPLEIVVKLFHAASIIVGAHGSLFANIIYSQQNTKIVEYCPDNRRDRSFRDKLKLANDYRQHFMPADSHHNIRIPLNHLHAELSQ